MQDIIGQELSIGDIVTDGRGKQWRLLETQPSFERQRIFSAIEVRPSKGMTRTVGFITIVRSYMSLKLMHVITQPEARRAYELAAASVREVGKEAVRRRKEIISELRGF